ncbi:ribonuclease P protein component [Glaciihabitans sp. UYNi722]|uniref:ribonuclease P protein component n=1 Tax=Glaciihabitans sp. UYNi722 TaxID=3156344 RepID=UPI0033972E7B
MLAKANRLVRADDYRRLVRRGRRISTEHAVVYVMHTDSLEQARFGFIVSKSVGVAVKRNLVRRRLKAVSHESLSSVAPGTDIVIRALPGAAQASWVILRSEISDAVGRGVTRA